MKIIILAVVLYAMCGYATQKIMFCGASHVKKANRIITFLLWPVLAITFGTLAFFCFLVEISRGDEPEGFYHDYVRKMRRRQKRRPMYHGIAMRPYKRRRF